MGVVYNSKVSKSYIKNEPCHQKISRQRTVKELTPQNIRFLKSLGLQQVRRRNAGRK